MITTLEALTYWKREDGLLTLELENGYEVCLEPLIFNQQWYLAVYKDKELVAPKVCVKIGYEAE